MSLPNGYKRLEYIQSSGTQYVDSGFKPSSNTKVVADYYTTSTQGAVIGSDNSWLNSDFVIEVHFAAFSSTVYNHSTVPSGRHTATLDKEAFSLDGKTLTTMAGTFTGSYNLTLFALNRSNVIQEYGTLQLFSCQIYDNDILVRDYIPCQTTAGEIGLWDDVNEVFYGNAGTGTFTAGPVVAIAVDSTKVTELEYIQSSGTQYVDTLFNPTQDTQLVLDAMFLGSAGTNVAGVRNNSSDTTNRFGIISFGSASKFGAFFRDSSIQAVTFDNNRHLYDLSKDGLVLDGTSYGGANTGSFACTYSLTLFAWNNGADGATCNLCKVYACQIYNNGTIVRNYIAAKLPDGTLGLYDKLHGLLYINAGSGAFTAGPEVPKAPPTPSGFTSGRLTDTTVKLSWTASDGATGYKLYKNGALLATLTDTSYTDTVQVFSSTVYAVTAYNDDGESTAAELTYCSIPENPILYLVTDRTESDVAYVKLLSCKGLGGMNDAEKAEWLSGLKGSYNASDLNRVGSAVDYVAGQLQSFGNAVEVYTKKDWATKDVPNVSAMKRYLNDVATLRAVLAVLSTTPEVPPDMDGLTYTEANNIEQILKDIDLLITNMTAAWFYSGDLYAGEV